MCQNTQAKAKGDPEGVSPPLPWPGQGYSSSLSLAREELRQKRGRPLCAIVPSPRVGLQPPKAVRNMDCGGMCWLLLVAFSPRPARPEGFANSTLPENRTDRMGATENGTDPLKRSEGVTTTSAFPLLQSSTQYKTDSPAPRQDSSASFWIPPLVAIVLLVGLFFMYRRKRGRESRSRAASINASSESDSEDDPATDQAARLKLPTELPEEALRTTEMLPPAMDREAGGPGC